MVANVADIIAHTGAWVDEPRKRVRPGTAVSTLPSEGQWRRINSVSSAWAGGASGCDRGVLTEMSIRGG